MIRRMACAAGAMLLAGLNGWTSPAHAQGPMAPRMDVAPPPARVAPPPPPVFVPPPVAPTPPPMPVAPVMAPPPPAPKAPTASAPAIPTPATPAPVATPIPTPAPPPATASKETPRSPAGGSPPYTDSQVKALRGVGVSQRGPGVQRQVTSDSNGVVSLAKLGPGRHELTIDPKSLGTGTQAGPQPVALVGLLLPAVQKVRDGERRYRTVILKPVNGQTPLQVRIDVDASGQVSTVDPGTGIGVNVATGDVNGDGRADIKLFEDLAKRNTSGETRLVFVTPVPGSTVAALAEANNILMDVSTTRLGTSPGNPGAGDKPTANEAAIVTSRSNIKRPSVVLPDIGVTATGPGGVLQARSDGGGWTRLGKLPVGNTVIEFSGADLASALRKTGTPTAPTAQQLEGQGSTGIIIGVVAAVRTDGTVAVFTGAVPASSVKSLKADLRIGRDGNAMEANWGNGQQLPQILPRTGAASLTVPGPNGPIPLDPAMVKSLQDRAAGSAPGLVDANNILMDVSTTR